MRMGLERGGIAGTLAALSVLSVAQVAPATICQVGDTVVDLECWVGDGEFETVVVIDWNETNGPYVTPSHAWGYRWSGTRHVSDALADIAAVGGLEVTTSYGGAFLDDINYDDGMDAHTNAGWTGWWWAGSSEDGGQTWSGNSGGINAEPLVHHEIEGFNMDSGNWTSETLTIPVPEPMTAMGVAAVGLLASRRRRKGDPVR